MVASSSTWTGDPRGELKPGKPLVLVAEDEPVLLKLFGAVLSKRGFSVVKARNGVEVVQRYYQALEGGVKPALVLMDHRMPVKNGLEAAKEILKKDKSAKILFISADISVRQEAIDVGAVGFLEKPVLIARLLSKIGEVLTAPDEGLPVPGWLSNGDAC